MIHFKVGDKVVYPNHGVGVIENIQSKTFGEAESTFYSLRILANDSTVLVPTANTKQVGLRPIMRKKEVSQVYDVLQSNDFRITDDWKGRYQANSDKMRTGDIRAVAEVFKTLTMLNEVKPLSYRERNRTPWHGPCDALAMTPA